MGSRGGEGGGVKKGRFWALELGRDWREWGWGVVRDFLGRKHHEEER